MQYKLIQKYLGSPEVGTNIYICPDCGTYYDSKYTIPTCIPIRVIKNNPEFWEKIEEKDYEILSFISNQKIISIPKDTIINRTSPGIFEGTFYRQYSESIYATVDALLKNEKWDIYSIRRLKDNQVFTLGDKIEGSEIIKKFYTGTDSTQKHMMFYNIGLSIYYLTLAKKSVLTTTDGVELFEETDIVYVPHYEFTSIKAANAKQVLREWNRNEKYPIFSTEEKAKEYIIFNKSCLSINEIFNDFEYYPLVAKGSLIELVKSKL